MVGKSAKKSLIGIGSTESPYTENETNNCCAVFIKASKNTNTGSVSHNWHN